MSGRRCQAIRPNGDPCRATPLGDRERCVFHDPAHAEEVPEARRLGGLRRRRERTLAGEYTLFGLGDVESIRRLLEIAAFDSLGLEASVPRVRAIVAVAAAAAKLLEVGDLERRIGALEAIYQPGGPRPAEPALAGEVDGLDGGLEQ